MARRENERSATLSNMVLVDECCPVDRASFEDFMQNADNND